MFRSWLASALLLATFQMSAIALALPFQEYRIKAAFILNFARFVEWPASTFADATKPMVICIVGDDPFDGLLEQLTRDEKVRGRQLVVRQVREGEAIGNCQILFFSQQIKERWPQLARAINGTSILTIGDTETVVRQGLIIGFVREGTKVRFVINEEAARAARLRISARILKLSKTAR